MSILPGDPKEMLAILRELREGIPKESLLSQINTINKQVRFHNPNQHLADWGHHP